jgi:hypothetical protein
MTVMMINSNEDICDKAMYESLLAHNIVIRGDIKDLKKTEALTLIGQSIFDRFVNEFSKIWKELFPNCRIKDFEATEEDWKQWLGSDYKISKKCKEVKEKMEFNIQDRVEEYIEILDEIRPKVESEEAAVAVLHEACKDRRSESFRKDEKKPRNNLVTEKQRRLMDDKGINYPNDVSRKEASRLINKYFENE